MRRHFKFLWLRRRSSMVPMSQLYVAIAFDAVSGKTALRFDSRVLHSITFPDLNPLAGVEPRGKADCLDKPRTRRFRGYFYGYADGAILNHADLRRTCNVGLRSRLFLLPVHIPCWPLRRVVIGDSEARWRGETPCQSSYRRCWPRLRLRSIARDNSHFPVLPGGRFGPFSASFFVTRRCEAETLISLQAGCHRPHNQQTGHWQRRSLCHPKSVLAFLFHLS